MAIHKNVQPWTPPPSGHRESSSSLTPLAEPGGPDRGPVVASRWIYLKRIVSFRERRDFGGGKAKYPSTVLKRLECRTVPSLFFSPRMHENNLLYLINCTCDTSASFFPMDQSSTTHKQVLFYVQDGAPQL